MMIHPPFQRLRERWLWLVSLMVVWWVLVDTLAVDAWVFGLVSMLIIVYCLPLPVSRGIRVLGLLRFAGFFVTQSLLAGVDVASRSLSLRIEPALIEYRPALPPGRGLGLFIGVISLLPGTLSVNWDAPILRVHVLDAGQDSRTALARVEQRVADLFGADP